MTMADVDGDGQKKLLVGSDDFEVRRDWLLMRCGRLVDLPLFSQTQFIPDNFDEGRGP